MPYHGPEHIHSNRAYVTEPSTSNYAPYFSTEEKKCSNLGAGERNELYVKFEPLNKYMLLF